MVVGHGWSGWGRRGLWYVAVSRFLCSGRPGVAVAAVFKSAALFGGWSLVHTGLTVEEGRRYWPLLSLLSCL